MTEKVQCLRCPSTLLERDPRSDAAIAFYHCPQCGRRFAQEPGRALTERWLGPLSIVLYYVLFSPQPQGRVSDVAVTLCKQESTERLQIILDEIRLELTSPSQPVRDILPGMPGSEEDLRAYLKGVADLISVHISA